MLGLVNQVIQRLSSPNQSSLQIENISIGVAQPSFKRREEDSQCENQTNVQGSISSESDRATESRIIPDFSQIQIPPNNHNHIIEPSLISSSQLSSPEKGDTHLSRTATSPATSTATLSTSALVSPAPVMAEPADIESLEIYNELYSSSLSKSHGYITSIPLVILPHTPPSSLTLANNQAPTSTSKAVR
jgi:hypothetical protein